MPQIPGRNRRQRHQRCRHGHALRIGSEISRQQRTKAERLRQGFGIHCPDRHVVFVPAARESEFIVACDVNTPFCGPDGAARVFAPQKGADPQTAEALDLGMRSFAQVIAEQFQTDIVPLSGAGAAGGLGGAFKAFLNARLTAGIEMVLSTKIPQSAASRKNCA